MLVIDDEPSWRKLLSGRRDAQPGGVPPVVLAWILTISGLIQLLNAALNSAKGTYGPIIATLFLGGGAVILIFGVVCLIRYYTRARR